MIDRIPKFTPPPSELSNATLLQRVSYLLASTFWTGHLPASGTWGALVAWLLHAFLFPNALTFQNWPIAIAILAVVVVIGTGCAEIVERMTGVKDDSRITIDEVAGYFVAVLFLPAGWAYTAPAFVLARIFDIVKPPPARQLECFHGGFGIMIDDIAASAYVFAIMHVSIYFFF